MAEDTTNGEASNMTEKHDEVVSNNGNANSTQEASTAVADYSAFRKSQKVLILLLCSLAGFFSPFSALAYFPGLEYIASDLGVSLQLMNLTITMYLVVQGVAPAIIGDVADQIGRRPVYLAVLTLYCVSCVALALQRSYPALLVLRMAQSAGSSGTIALAMMVVADLAPPHSRGSYVGAMISGPNSAPSLGPVVGGLLAELVGWPWIFWFLAILGGVCLVPIALFFPETNRLIVGNGNLSTYRLNTPPLHLLSPAKTTTPVPSGLMKRMKRAPNPFKCLKIVLRRNDFLLLAAYAVVYTSYSCVQASLAPLVMQYYGLNALQAGLCYLAYGIATLSSSYLIGKVLDHDYKALAKKSGIVINRVGGDNVANFPIEHARIRNSLYFVVCSICSTAAFGWTIETRVHLSVTLVITFIAGVSYTGVFNTCLTMNVDLNPNETGLASVAASVVRCLAAAGGVAAMQPMLDSIGAGWTFTVYAALGLLSLPLLLVLRSFGPEWRGVER